MDAGGDPAFARFHGGGGECGSRSSGCTGRCSTPSSRPASRPGIPRARRLQRRRQRGRRLLRGEPEGRLALERGAGLPAAGGGAARTSWCGPAPRSSGWCSSRRRPRGSPAPGVVLRGARSRAGGAARRWCWRRGRSTRRSCCSSRGSGRRRCWRGTGSRWSPTCRRSGGNLQDHLQIRSVYKVTGARHAERARGGLARQGADRARVRAPAERADEHGAEPARGLHPLGPGAEPRQHRVPCPAAQPRRLRRAAPRLSGDHRQRLQPQPDEPGPVEIASAAGRGRAADPAELSRDRRRPAGRGGEPAGDAARSAPSRRWRAMRRSSGSPGSSTRATRTSRGSPGTSRRRSSIRSGRRRWARTATPAAVLDPRLRVRDGRGGRIAGLRVVDAGAMPVITSGNTNAPVLMMAEKAARWIRAEG